MFTFMFTSLDTLLARASPKGGNGLLVVNRWVARRARFPVPGAPLGR
jgi:hypothetical protein